MPITPLLQEIQRIVQERKTKRTKDLKVLIEKIESGTAEQIPPSFVMKMVLTETMKRDEEIFVLLDVFVGISGYIDSMGDAMNALDRRLREVASSKSKIQEIEALAKKHNEMFEFIQCIVKQRAESAQKETTYVQ